MDRKKSIARKFEIIEMLLVLSMLYIGGVMGYFIRDEDWFSLTFFIALIPIAIMAIIIFLINEKGGTDRMVNVTIPLEVMQKHADNNEHVPLDKHYFVPVRKEELEKSDVRLTLVGERIGVLPIKKRKLKTKEETKDE